MTALKWIGGEHDFALDIGGLRALQNACDAGPEQIFRRILSGQWRIDDLYQTIRLGLIGGGMADRDAARVVDTAFRSHPVMLFRTTAHTVLLLSLLGDADDPLGEAQGATAPPENGGLASSTETGPS
jgi:hypothetical protein